MSKFRMAWITHYDVIVFLVEFCGFWLSLGAILYRILLILFKILSSLTTEYTVKISKVLEKSLLCYCNFLWVFGGFGYILSAGASFYRIILIIFLILFNLA